MIKTEIPDKQTLTVLQWLLLAFSEKEIFFCKGDLYKGFILDMVRYGPASRMRQKHKRFCYVRPIIPDKKIAYSRIFHFSELNQILQLFHDSVQTGVEIKEGSKCISMKYSPYPREESTHPTNKRNAYSRVLSVSFPHINGIQRIWRG